MKSQILPEEDLIIIRMGQASLCNNCGCRAVDESKFVNHDDKIPAASFFPVRGGRMLVRVGLTVLLSSEISLFEIFCWSHRDKTKK
jgi:hypothetical protein